MWECCWSPVSQSPAAGQAEHVCPVGTYTCRKTIRTRPIPWTNREQCPYQHPHKHRRCSHRHEQHRQPDPVTPLLLIRIEVHQRSHTRTVVSSDTSPRHSGCASARLQAPVCWVVGIWTYRSRRLPVPAQQLAVRPLLLLTCWSNLKLTSSHIQRLRKESAHTEETEIRLIRT